MEINLIPKEPFVVKHFMKLLMLVFSLLLFISVMLMQYVLHQDVYLGQMEEKVSQLEQQKAQIEKAMNHNQQVLQRENELKSFRKYKALIEGIEVARRPSWQNVLKELYTAMPKHAQLLKLQGEGNQLVGQAALYSLSDTAYFMDKVEKMDTVDKVYLQILDQPEVYQQYYFQPGQVKIIEFTLYKKNRSGVEVGDD